MTFIKKLSVFTSVLALSAVPLAPATAQQPAEPQPLTPAETVNPVLSPETATLTFEKPSVTTSPAPIVYADPAPVPITKPAAPQTIQAPVQTQAAAPATNFVKTPAPSAPAAPVASSGKGAIIASAALAQLGIAQDCTALASNALSAAGINFHGWPADYLSLGTVVSGAEAQPGDLIYYASAGAGVPHIAVYIGNGQAVHGGFDGSTKVFTAYQGSGPVFIRV